MGFILTFTVALLMLGLAHIMVTIQLFSPGSKSEFGVPPYGIAFALDVLALLLIYWV